MSAVEITQWNAFEQVEGPILLHDRIETSVAMAAFSSAAPYLSRNQRVTLADFIPQWDSTETKEFEQSADDIIETLKSLAIKKYDDGEGGSSEFYGSGGDVHP